MRDRDRKRQRQSMCLIFPMKLDLRSINFKAIKLTYDALFELPFCYNDEYFMHLQIFRSSAPSRGVGMILQVTLTKAPLYQTKPVLALCLAKPKQKFPAYFIAMIYDA